MSSQEYGSPSPNQAAKLLSPPCGTYGSTNDDADSEPGLTKLVSSFDGQNRSWQDIKKKEWMFIIVFGIAIVTSTVLTIYKLATVDKHHTDFLFGLVIIVNACFCSYYLWHGVRKERHYEIIILFITTTIMVVYIIINFAKGLHGTIKLVRLIIACCLELFVVGMGGWLVREYRQSGYLIFRTAASGDPELQAMCNKLFLFMDLLKLDFQLGITLALFTQVNDPDVNALDWVALGGGLVISAAWFILGHVCVRRESKILTYLFTVLSPVQLCYVIYKIAMASTHLKLYPVLAPCSITTGCLAFVVRVTVIILNYLVSMNYGTGLNEKVFRERP